MLSAPPSPGPLPSLLAEPSLAPRPTPLGTLLPPIGALSLAVCLERSREVNIKNRI